MGRVDGEFISVGGAQPQFGTGQSGPRSTPIRGAITLTDTTTHATFSGTAGSDGKFSISVPAGNYKAAGSTTLMVGPSDGFNCDASMPVAVAAHETATVTIECLVP